MTDRADGNERFVGAALLLDANEIGHELRRRSRSQYERQRR
jgi:hypothetical protein